MKMTPSGTRTCLTSSPLGRRLDGDDLADRVGQRGDVEQALGHLVDPLGFERQAVDRRGVQPVRRRGLRRRGRWPRGSPRGASSNAAAEPFSQAFLAAPRATASCREASLASSASVRHRLRVITLLGSSHSSTLNDRAHGESPQPRKAVQTLMASTIGATSWTRTTRAPCRHAASDEATDADARSTTGRPVILPRNPLRDVPIRIAHPSVSNRSRFRKISRLCSMRLAEADARVDGDPLAGDAVGLGPLDPTRQEVVDLGDDVVVVRVDLHGGRGALHVHEHDAGARLGGDAGHVRVGAQRGDVVDDRRRRRRGPGGRLRPWSCRSRSGSTARSASASTTGITRRSSSSSETGSAPGRLDSPPRSSRSAPSATSRRACDSGRLDGRQAGRRRKSCPASG